MPLRIVMSELAHAPRLSPNTSTRGRRSGSMAASRCLTPHSRARNCVRPSGTFWVHKKEGNRPYWIAQVAMSPRVNSSALSIMVWSIQPVPVGLTSSRWDRPNAPVRSSSSRAISARPPANSGSVSNPT